MLYEVITHKTGEIGGARMLDQLVESRTGRQGAELRKRLLIGCGLTIVAGAAVVLLGSLFSQTLAMGFDGIDAARLVLPIRITSYNVCYTKLLRNRTEPQNLHPSELNSVGEFCIRASAV